MLGLGIYDHKVGCRRQGIWYEPTGRGQLLVDEEQRDRFRAPFKELLQVNPKSREHAHRMILC